MFEAGSFGVEVHPDVAPQPGNIVALEHWTASGFVGTDLDYLLSQRGIDRVVIAGNRANSCGNRANTCVDSAGRYAVELGYHATLISDAISASSQEETDASQEEMDATIKTDWPSFGHAVLTTGMSVPPAEGSIKLIPIRDRSAVVRLAGLGERAVTATSRRLRARAAAGCRRGGAGNRVYTRADRPRQHDRRTAGHRSREGS